MKLLAFAASLSRDSMNRRLLGKAVDIAAASGAEIDVAEFREFDMPLYDFDLQGEAGFPSGALEMARRIVAADGMIVASPEYNHSLPGILKNAVDWLSMMEPCCLDRHCAVLISASLSPVGGYRGLQQLRTPLECKGTWVHPRMFSLGRAQQAYDDGGNLKDPKLAGSLESLIADFMSAAPALRSRED